MSIEERIKAAKKKRNEAYRKDSVQGIVYWDGYLDALKAVKEDLGMSNETVKITKIYEHIEITDKMRKIANEMQEAISTEYKRRVLEDERKLEAVLRANGWVKAEEIFEQLKSAGLDEWRYPIIAELKKKYESEKDNG